MCWARLLLVLSNAVFDLAERTSKSGGLDAFDDETGGASSIITWALVPPTPNELTLALRGSGPFTHSLGFVLT